MALPIDRYNSAKTKGMREEQRRRKRKVEGKKQMVRKEGWEDKGS